MVAVGRCGDGLVEVSSLRLAHQSMDGKNKSNIA